MDTHHPSNILRDAQVAGWYIGIPLYDVVRRRWQMYAFDTSERAHTGKRPRERTVVAQTEEECIREMARCLREIGRARSKVS